MKIKTGAEVRITSNADALEEYGSEQVAGLAGNLLSDEPTAILEGLMYYDVQVTYLGTFKVREDHFVANVRPAPVVENEDLRWRRAAQWNWAAIHAAKAKSDV